MRRIAAFTICGLLALTLAAGFGGALHPAGDSLAVFRWPLVLLFCAAALTL